MRQALDAFAPGDRSPSVRFAAPAAATASNVIRVGQDASSHRPAPTSACSSHSSATAAMTPAATRSPVLAGAHRRTRRLSRRRFTGGPRRRQRTLTGTRCAQAWRRARSRRGDPISTGMSPQRRRRPMGWSSSPHLYGGCVERARGRCGSRVQARRVSPEGLWGRECVPSALGLPAASDKPPGVPTSSGQEPARGARGPALPQLLRRSAMISANEASGVRGDFGGARVTQGCRAGADPRRTGMLRCTADHGSSCRDFGLLTLGFAVGFLYGVAVCAGALSGSGGEGSAYQEPRSGVTPSARWTHCPAGPTTARGENPSRHKGIIV
ncbi:hypothetical protein SAMN05216267_10646 [Actinacidiphila rubida]|uniref:Uncharacterized protein n=1 Tax=Actinacidiphila rubida TaxID=310780 RepID=A0A1H8U4A9_9ACTN|nr:hypothetical protein SAMN05216267_10646 [Actinacidiphila rubida]